MVNCAVQVVMFPEMSTRELIVIHIYTLNCYILSGFLPKQLLSACKNC